MMAGVNDVHEARGLGRFRSGDRALGNDLINIYFGTMGAGLGGGGALRSVRGGEQQRRAHGVLGSRCAPGYGVIG